MSDRVLLDSTEVPPGQRAGEHSQAQLALADVRRLVRHLGDELANYRKRALSAEARLKALDELAASGAPSPERSIELERENAELRARLDAARARTKAMIERVRFLRQQHGDGTT